MGLCYLESLELLEPGPLSELVAEAGSLTAYFWRFEAQAVPGVRATAPESVALSKDLKKRGWRFVGPTTCYAFMQAMGLVNDHAPGCAIHGEVARARASFRPPGSAKARA